ncbi:MAG TPA: DNA-directed RNA polymerase subunit alpha C-terminal domain-containing protein [Anaerolineaceae bacterium]
MQARQDYVEQAKARETARTSLERPLAELELGTRATEALTKANVVTVGQALDLLAQGEAKLLEIDGFGRKALIDMKKKLRQLGYDLPAAASEIAV